MERLEEGLRHSIVDALRGVYFDERPRMERSHREFAESLRRGRKNLDLDH